MIYGDYAAVYDMSGQIRFSLLMMHYLKDLLQRHAVSARRVLDLACGTGTLALLLADEGWEVVGLDASAAMLARAQAKHATSGQSSGLSFVQGDMRSLLPLLSPAQFDLVLCTYDSLNYLLTEADMAACMHSVAAVLAPGGLFIADMNTRHFLEHDWAACEIYEQPGYVQINQSSFDPQQATSTLKLTGFVGNNDQGYTRFDEIHIERAYPPKVVAALFKKAALRVEAIYDCFTFAPPCATTQRLAWVVRKPAIRT